MDTVSVGGYRERANATKWNDTHKQYIDKTWTLIYSRLWFLRWYCSWVCECVCGWAARTNVPATCTETEIPIYTSAIHTCAGSQKKPEFEGIISMLPLWIELRIQFIFNKWGALRSESSIIKFILSLISQDILIMLMITKLLFLYKIFNI